MKYLLLIIAIASTSLVAEDKVAAPAAPQQQQIRFRHVQDNDGRLLATIDIKDGSIEFKEDPKKVVTILVSVVDNLAGELQKLQATPLPAAVVKKKK